MADEGKREQQQSFDTTTPLDREHLRAWVEYFASQLEDSDTVEITLTRREGSGRRAVTFQAPADVGYNPCPMRHGEKIEPEPEPDPEAEAGPTSGSGDS